MCCSWCVAINAMRAQEMQGCGTFYHRHRHYSATAITDNCPVENIATYLITYLSYSTLSPSSRTLALLSSATTSAISALLITHLSSATIVTEFSYRHPRGYRADGGCFCSWLCRRRLQRLEITLRLRAHYELVTI